MGVSCVIISILEVYNYFVLFYEYFQAFTLYQVSPKVFYINCDTESLKEEQTHTNFNLSSHFNK